jgi:DNA-binding transcriptional LysR family regulator
LLRVIAGKIGRTLAEFQVVTELGSNEAIKEAVLRGLGVTVLSTFAVQKEIKSGQLKSLEVTDLHSDRDMFIVQDRRRVLPLPARVFLNFLETNPIPAMKP